MDKQRKLKTFAIVMLLCGGACLLGAFSQMPVERFDYKLLILTILTLGFGSRMTIQIPALKSHLSVSDTFISCSYSHLRAHELSLQLVLRHPL